MMAVIAFILSLSSVSLAHNAFIDGHYVCAQPGLEIDIYENNLQIYSSVMDEVLYTTSTGILFETEPNEAPWYDGIHWTHLRFGMGLFLHDSIEFSFIHENRFYWPDGQVVDEFIESDTFVFRLSGGEPILEHTQAKSHPDYHDILDETQYSCEHMGS